ncbi:MAG: leucyl/phenylalanyl-tRNA--protein transferase [Myxococcota bacterium]|jgi:leucyl/phenylalanyl-tRNA--protein transferase|nr:leucyl/phenylalanyl-tRNA--protein transferase [Myxococcota bacterium]
MCPQFPDPPKPPRTQASPRALWDHIKAAYPFPDPRGADPATGLVAIEGDLAPERLLSAYAHGIFPWYNQAPILWFSPDPRMLLRFEDLRINRTLRKNLRRRRFDVRLDTSFSQVIRACAQVPRPGQEGTWISDEVIAGYEALHELGFAHSVEAFREDRLVGGMYGVSIGAAFFGESMFASESEASKVAFVHLARQLEAWQFDFLDCQVHTEHTERFGARECSRDEFLAILDATLERETRRGQWHFERDFAEFG